MKVGSTHLYKIVLIQSPLHKDAQSEPECE